MAGPDGEAGPQEGWTIVEFTEAEAEWPEIESSVIDSDSDSDFDSTNPVPEEAASEEREDDSEEEAATATSTRPDDDGGGGSLGGRPHRKYSRKMELGQRKALDDNMNENTNEN